MALNSIWLTVASILAAFDIKPMSKPLNENIVEPKFLAIGVGWCVALCCYVMLDQHVS